MANSSKDKQKNIAKHIAIIMDGNGRWAISNSLNISKGHSKGVEIVREIVEESIKQKISSLTLYAFSSENWSRPKPEIEKAISNSNLGLNPSTSSDLIRITMPALTEETRQDYIKQARAEAENSRVSIRNIRRDANQASKELQSSGEISEDDLRRIEDLIQKETDKYIGLVDSELKAKESDLLEI